ncbi:MAG: hypothetical protein C7B44_05730 [Sulfobacillus thermosulfidooxidans]|uniref:Uncharacterized protein n=1 Tax=Sulfobacillus thermosulfidooxidans (strain DSM 9293 / VKM B-1269 / AT-1) TaxID=929705 RepID=A0A1W1WPL5_SULTA|nr:DUF6166 domain-containing protein [Sulfobacillus thermosulfidooxidans]PSR37064.1 MAG: hypothetical protein C7B44_05730 [Sulfobacillus thermosulfidooxidans]SMC08155.1 hypothetical protein SAMN00768000_3693 [Sulfobacillus thermosulfidooxidans DSM 9293]
MKTYHGMRLENGVALVQIEDHENGHITYRSSRNEDHPEFDWGYNGMGPYYLAQFLVQDAMPFQDISQHALLALDHVIAHWTDGWTVTSDDIARIVMSA